MSKVGKLQIQKGKADNMQHTFQTASEAIAEYGLPTVARRKTLVRTRPVKGESEVFAKKGGDLTAVAGVDLVVVPVDGSPEYPCKIELFAGEKGAWEEVESGVYRRKALCQYLDIPEGDTVVCKTREGDVTVSFPDAIALGVDGEVYSYRRAWIEANLEPVN